MISASKENTALKLRTRRVRMKGALIKAFRKARPLKGGERRLSISEPVPKRQTGEAHDDPARLLECALTTLMPALMRATIHGRPVTIDVADEETAAAFRAVLSKTREDHPTNDLIRIRVTS